jgi:hypothetical protein
MKQLICLVLVLTAARLASAYNVSDAVKWISKMGCSNATITNCPGNRLCTDAEFYARALAAGGVIDLNPNDLSQVPYTNYKGFNLCLGAQFVTFLQFAGFTQSAPGTRFPPGSIILTKPWYPPGMPVFVLGDGLCDSHTPIIAGGPHCDMGCLYFVPEVVMLPPP